MTGPESCPRRLLVQAVLNHHQIKRSGCVIDHVYQHPRNVFPQNEFVCFMWFSEKINIVYLVINRGVLIMLTVLIILDAEI
jgi:hypothetical protein